MRKAYPSLLLLYHKSKCELNWPFVMSLLAPIPHQCLSDTSSQTFAPPSFALWTFLLVRQGPAKSAPFGNCEAMRVEQLRPSARQLYPATLLATASAQLASAHTDTVSRLDVLNVQRRYSADLCCGILSY